MTDKKDPNKKHYFDAVTTEDFAQGMAIQCLRNNQFPVTIWEKGESEELAEVYLATSYSPETKTIKMLPTGNLVTKIKGSLKAGKIVLIKIPIDDKINYFTGGKFKFHPEDITYSLQIEQDIYKAQQRGNFRLNANEVIPIQFKIDDQVFEAIDISIGGTSFMVDDTDKFRFAKGQKFSDCTLRFDRKNYYIPQAHVAALIPMIEDGGVPNGKYKVGISFVNLPEKTKEELYIKISTEARGDEMKKKFDSILAKKSE